MMFSRTPPVALLAQVLARPGLTGDVLSLARRPVRSAVQASSGRSGPRWRWPARRRPDGSAVPVRSRCRGEVGGRQGGAQVPAPGQARVSLAAGPGSRSEHMAAWNPALLASWTSASS